MSTQGELIKDCMNQIMIYELMLDKNPESKELQKLLKFEKEKLKNIQNSNFGQNKN